MEREGFRFTPMAAQLFPDTLRSALDEREDVICVLDPHLRLVYCNPAWDRFALANQGEGALSESVLGTSLLDTVTDPLKRFFQHAFAAVASSGNPFEFDYECSSADCFRLFRMHILPLKPGGGFLVVHSLRVEEPHARVSESPDQARYRGANGMVVVCAHCRRTRRAQEPGTWDWVPAHLEDRSLPVSHGLCPVCRVYFYPDIT
jgi:PAS domain-containing protein